MGSLSCFKAYDIRGKLGQEINEALAYRIGYAVATYLKGQTLALGGDIRQTSESLKKALANGICDAGTDVIDLGMTGTEQVYFAAFSLEVDGGIEVTASHNPIDYNGMKLVGRGATPIGMGSGLEKIKRLVQEQEIVPVELSKRGQVKKLNLMLPYVEHILGYIDTGKLRPMKLLFNAGNGAAGPTIDAIEAYFQTCALPIEMVKINNEPDGTFPNGIPNPLLPENRLQTAQEVIATGADLGLAFDGDFDRCFFFDETGQFIEGYYLVSLFAQAFLQKCPGETLVHDPRLTWNTLATVADLKGLAVQSQSGHAFMKQCMRETNAIYGGEMSAHHYFRDFGYCDSGMIPWLVLIEILSTSGKPLSELVREMMEKFPCSGEINYRVKEVKEVLDAVQSHYKQRALAIELIDGLSMEFDSWRFNLRGSNTEPLLRVNIETRGDKVLLDEKIAEITQLISQH